MKRACIIVVLFWLICLVGVANAGLTTIGTASYGGESYKLIYEPLLGGQGLVWLDYTNDFDAVTGQERWAAGLNGPGVLVYELNPGISVTWIGDWRLPSAGDNPQIGYNQTTSEMGHLYYISLGNTASPGASEPAKIGDFEHFNDPPNPWHPWTYWSSTIYSDPAYEAWYYFELNTGRQDFVWGGNVNSALAVRNADVAPVPLPPSALLFASGLVAWAGLRKIRKK